MHSLGPETQPPPKLLAGSAIKIRIALASSLILAVGAWLAPRADQTTLSAPPELTAPLLEEQVREASRPFSGVQDVAARVREHSVAIPTPVRASPGGGNDFSEADSAPLQVAGFGVFVTDTHVLAHSAALDGRSSVQLSPEPGRTLEARVVAYEPPSGLVLLQTEPSKRPPVILAADAPAAGALAVGVGRSEGRDIAVPVFITGVGNDRYTIGAVNESILPGMPVFNLAGELFAIAVPDGREVRAIPAREAANRLTARASVGERRSSFGLAFQVPDEPLTRMFGERGLIITEVVPGGPADGAGVEVGDVLLAMGVVALDSVETATRALSSAPIGTATPLQVRRAGRVRTVDVTPALAYEVAALARANLEDSSGPEARVLFPAQVLERAAIPPSARVLSVNGRAVTSRAQAQRELNLARNTVPVLLRQGNTRFFVALEPTR
jgi:S1-C subfamily serine protease